MALPYKITGWPGSKSRGAIDAIEKQLKSLTLKPAKRVTFSFNPYQDGVKSIRETTGFLHRPEIRESNINCVFKTTVHNTTEEPLLVVKLDTGKIITFKTEKLTALEIIQKFNQLISSMERKADAVKK